MSLDVSPDSRHIVFDLAGDLFEIPITGGVATRLTAGAAFDAQPRYAPDGRSIAFISDRSGADDVWLMRRDTGELRALTRENGSFFVSPEWTPGGQSIVVSRTTREEGHAREYQLFVYPLAGGTARQLTGTAEVRHPMILGAAFAGDPLKMFAAVKVGPKWPSVGQWQIGVVDGMTGSVDQLTDELNGALRPTASPDGRYLVYGTRWAKSFRLRLLDLHSRETRWLLNDMDRDGQGETAPRRDLMPGAAFTPDGRALILSHHGKLWSVSVPDGTARAIPFSAEVDAQLAPIAQFDHSLDARRVTARRIEQPQLSPDGRWLAFSALDRIWIQPIANRRGGATGASPRKIDTGADSAFFPVWSPDGRYLAYVSWHDLNGGAIWRVRMPAGSAPQRLTSGRDFYEKLAYSPDGRRLLAARAPFARRSGFFNETRGIGRVDSREWVTIPAGGGEARAVTTIHPVTAWGVDSHYGRAHFVGGDANRIYFTDPVEGLVSVGWDGSQRRTLLRVQGPAFKKQQMASEILLSPDGRRALALLNGHLWQIELPPGREDLPTVVLPSPTPALPARRLSRDGADFPQWIDGGDRVVWTLGSTVFQHGVQPIDAQVSAAQVEEEEPQRWDIDVSVATNTPRGSLLLRGARAITMRGDEVVEDADILIVDGRIRAVSRRAPKPLPPNTRILDVSGKTVLPGYVDVHWHGDPPWSVHRSHVWEFLTSLAYGVTTVRDPQPSTMDALTYADRIAAGEVLGPRFFTTGRGIFISDGIGSAEDARAIARRHALYYRTETLKDYMVNGDRLAHQWLADAAREYRLALTAEANSDFKSSLTRLLDGYGGQEHMATMVKLYGDVVRLMAGSGTTYTPTLLQGQSGGMERLRQYVRAHDLRADAKVRRFFPEEEIEYLSVDADRAPVAFTYSTSELVGQSVELLAAGGRVALGVHGAIHGLGAHWVLWTLVEGGMRPMDALRVGTVLGAQAIGHGGDLGTIEPGKLADLQVLDGNPLEQIRDTLTLRYVLIDGRLYDASSLDQLWPVRAGLGPQWWQAQTPRSSLRDHSGTGRILR